VNLGLELSPRIKGFVPSQPLQYAVVRTLTPEDIPLLDLPRGPTAVKSLQRLTDRHHAAARYIAQGFKDVEVAAITGYAQNRIYLLRQDPAFKELIEFYRSSEDKERRNNFERLSGLTADAADVLQDRLETAPEDVTTGQLIEIIKVGADRSGNGPQTSNVQYNVNVGLADKLKKAREQAALASRPASQVIEGEAVEIPLTKDDLGAA
jgi:hypothetical protein